jgi:hypothetical protein
MGRSIVLLCCIVLFSFGGEGNSEMGRTIYKYIFKPALGYVGDDFVSQHSAKEWETLFADDAKGFKKEFGGKSAELDALFESKRFTGMIPHLEAFAVEFANDSGYSPHCTNLEEGDVEK